MTKSVIVDWTDEKRASFRKDVVTARHNLHLEPEFSDQALAELIDCHPRDMLDINTMGYDPADKDSLRTGDAGSLKGHELIEAVRKGRLWLNIREVSKFNPVYKSIFDRFFTQMAELNPGFKSYKTYPGIIISSQGAFCPYHCDLTEVFLFHIKGKKRFRVYPAQSPWVSDESIENILHKDHAHDIQFDPDWDRDAQCIDLEAGDFITWPLYGPHRVENIEGLNVSISCEYATRQSVLTNGVFYTNGLMRRWGMKPRSTHNEGFQAYAKLAVAQCWKLISRFISKPSLPEKYTEKTFNVDVSSETGFCDHKTV